MNDFGLVQLIWIKRLVSETSRINTLVECNRLSHADLNRYKSVISSIDDFCALSLILKIGEILRIFLKP